jgi:hypothetical protein
MELNGAMEHVKPNVEDALPSDNHCLCSFPLEGLYPPPYIPHRGTTLCQLVPFLERYSVPESFGFPEFQESGNALPYTEHHMIYCPRLSSATVTILIGLHLSNETIYYTLGEDLQGTPTSIHLYYYFYVYSNVRLCHMLPH